MDNNVIKNLIRLGVVSSKNPSTMTVRVVFDGKENLVSAELPVLNRGSQQVKDYWLPDVGEQVVCLFLPNSNGNGVNEGYVLGSHFSTQDAPVKTGDGIRRIDFGDGSYVEHDRSSGNLTIHATGVVTITGAEIRLN